MSNSKYYEKDGIKLILGDSLEAMKSMPDNSFDIAIVDPPYGIGAGNKNFAIRGKNKEYHRKNDWDTNIPEKAYFDELWRVSKNQIVWGANYMVEFLKPSMGWIYWDKLNGEFSLSDGELAWTSFNKALRSFKKNVASERDRYHPTQKPVALYEWLLKNYTNDGDRILDTHLGSGSIAIACHRMKRQLVGYEIDEEYFNAACKRFDEQTRQQRLW